MSKKEINETEFQTFCYENELEYDQLSPWHFKVVGIQNTVDVWPISKKYYHPSMGKSKVYDKPKEMKYLLK